MGCAQPSLPKCGLRESVSRIEGKLDGIATITDQLDDHEERIRHLEANRWPWP